MIATGEDRTVTLSASFDHTIDEVAKVLVDGAPAVIAGGGARDKSRLVVELEVPIGQHGSVHRAAVLALGAADWTGDRFHLPLQIAALESERWFPTFSGALEVEDADLGSSWLRMCGEYHLPLGALGRASGPHGGDQAARASLYALFLVIVAGVERELRESAPAWRPAALGESLLDIDRPVGA